MPERPKGYLTGHHIPARKEMTHDFSMMINSVLGKNIKVPCPIEQYEARMKQRIRKDRYTITKEDEKKHQKTMTVAQYLMNRLIEKFLRTSDLATLKYIVDLSTGNLPKVVVEHLQSIEMGHDGYFKATRATLKAELDAFLAKDDE